jgi:DMSO/TMAO reductase YedYZ heme-binding membrane subunit
MAQTPAHPGDPSADPVLVRRRQLARWAELGQRLGYLLFGIAIVLFVVATITELPRAIVAAIIASMALGSVVLAPSIIVGYGVRAADREDRERATATRRQQGNVSP